MTHPAPGPVARALTAAATAVLALAGLLVAAGPAAAAASVTVSGGTVSADGPSTVRVSGAGFQSIDGAFGGIYVVFGWVSDPAGGTWKPSAGGRTGADYRYAPDTESTQNQGFQRFVAFPGSDTAGAANGGLIAADGTWSTDLVIPGARFVSQDRSGAQSEVDCTQVQCGVITFGAHGVVNPSNETFTPITFGAAAPAAGGAAPETTTGAPAAEVATERAPASLGVDRATAVQGRAMTFAAQGFEPGEQVVGTLDSGVVSVGPLTAGAHGEVAGVLQLPSDLRVGTHVLKLTGAQSGLAPEVEVTVTRDPAEANAADLVAAADASAASDGDDGALGVVTGLSAPELAVAGAGALLLVVVLLSFVTALRRKRAGRRAGPSALPAAGAAGADRTQTLPPVRVPVATGPAPAHAPAHAPAPTPAPAPAPTPAPTPAHATTGGDR
ncbi:hypothetical protein [Cellulomonas sp. Marseille-Q8402]